MSKFFYAIFLALALAFAASAQTRRGTTTAGQRPTTPSQGRAAAQPTPAASGARTTGAQQQASANTPVATNAAAEDCGCEPGPLPEVLASVNGVKITQADISPETQQQIAEYKRRVVETRKAELNLQINSILLDAEAKKRGVPSTKLLEDEIVAKTVEPTQADAQAFFNQNKAQIEQQAGGPVDFTQAKDQIVAYLRSQRQDERAKAFAQSLRASGVVKVLVSDPTPPATPADRARVFATVNGKEITSGDIEDSILPLVAQVRDQLYLLRKNDVDLKVNDILLSQEAQKRGVTARALIESEVTSKIPVVTEAQAQEFYNKNKDRINGDFATIKYQIIQYLQQQEQQRLEGAFAERLRNGATVQTFITPPVPVAYNIATDDQPEKGNPNARVTVVEFTDYQCPSCAAAQPALERLMNEYADRVRFVIRDFPLQQHADAEKAAEAAEAAREQGKYWDFTAILFHNQSALQPDKLKQYAQVLGLDRTKFDAALDSGKFADKVQRDQLDGQKVGVNSTPSFFVNGVRVSEVTYEGLKSAIDSALKSPAKP